MSPIASPTVKRTRRRLRRWRRCPCLQLTHRLDTKDESRRRGSYIFRLLRVAEPNLQKADRMIFSSGTLWLYQPKISQRLLKPKFQLPLSPGTATVPTRVGVFFAPSVFMYTSAHNFSHRLRHRWVIPLEKKHHWCVWLAVHTVRPGPRQKDGGSVILPREVPKSLMIIKCAA